MGLSRPKLVALAVAVAAAAALAQSGYTYTVNGKKVSIETIERNGKVYVEASAAFKALGASVTFDKAKKSFVVVTAGQNQAQAVQGTTQLAGGEGALGKTYTLGKDNQALNFTLDSAEFSVTRVTMGGYVYAPKPNEKLLILRFTVQNPTKSEARLAYHSFKMTAVDATDINHEMDSYIAREGTSDIIDVALKPAQKIQAYSVIKVPAAGPIPKLIVARGSGSNTPVVRYDLRGKVKALTAPFAETTDASGVTAAETVTAKAGTYYPGKNFDLKLDSVAFSSEPMDKKTPKEGTRWLVATFTMRNGLGKTANAQRYAYHTYEFNLIDADGEREKFDGYLIKASRDEHADGELKPGEEARFRIFFEVPANVGVKTITAKEGDARTYSFDVSGAK